MNKANNWWFVLGIVALSTFAQSAWAATCTSKASGNWNSAATWNCTAGTIPAGGDTVVIASPHAVTLNNNYSAANLTINSGGVLVDGGRDLTLSGNAVINGTYDGAGNNGQLIMTGVGATLSGNGTFIDINRIQVDNSVTIPAGASLELTLNAEIRVNGTLTIDGSVTGAGQNASNRILRVNGGGALVVGATGAINAPNSVGEIRTNATATNSGSVILQSLTTQGNGTWTNLPGASCAAPPVCVGGTVNSINLASASPTNAASVSWTVTFNSSVTGLTAGNFALVNSGLGGTPAITGVSGSGTTWTVSASTGTGTGTLGLNMANVTGISPAIVTPMPFAGQVYTLDRLAPAVSSIVLANPSPTSLASVSWTVTFSEAVTGVDATDFALLQAGGVSGAAITGVAAVSGTIYTVTAGTGTGTGTLGLNLSDNDSIVDAASNPLGGAGAGNGNFSGDAYSVVRPMTVTASPTACVNDASIGTQAWTGLTGPFASDDIWASASGINSQITNYLKCTGYGFAIPAGATINGITVAVEHHSQRTMNDHAVQLVKAGAIQPTNYATNTRFPNPDAYTVYGGAIDLWGNTWTATDINNTNFGVAFAAQRGPFNTTDTAYVDHMTITVDYTLPVTPPSPIAEYRMDELSWNGTTNEAVDSGTGGFHGTAAGLTTKPATSNASPAIAGSPGTCRYGVFNRLNKDYLALEGFPNLAAAAGEFAITAWINVADNTLPGQRIFIDDQTNSSPGGWGFSVGETTAFGVGGLRFYYRQPSVYILDTVAIPSNQWLFVALSVRLVAGANASSATIYAYNTAGTLVASNTGTFTWTAGSDPGPASIGGETNASGEGTNAFGFGGNLDEVRVYQSALSQSQVAAIATQTHACTVAAPDHIRIEHDGNGLTCSPDTVTITACANANCTAPHYSGGVDVTLTPGGQLFTVDATGINSTAIVQQSTVGAATLGATSIATTAATCWNTATLTASCDMTFSDSGFVVTVPDHVSCNNASVTIEAVETAPGTGRCVPAYKNTTRAVNLKCAYVSPTTGTLPVNAAGVALNSTNSASGTCDGVGQSPTLSFGADGTATISLNYADAGKLTLIASDTAPTGKAMTGSGTFVVAPASFEFSGIPAAPLTAGQAFNATVTAMNACATPATTPNFTGQTVAITSSNPQPGIGNATAINASLTVTSGTGSANLTWDEVGTVDLDANLSNYLGSALSISGSQAGVGRFRPAYFGTTVVATATTPMPCPAGLACPALYNGFVYSSQPFSVQVTARNLAGGTTANYAGAFAYASTLTTWDALGSTTNENPGPGALANAAIAAADFTAGVATLATPAYTFDAAATAPTDIYLRAADTDGVTSLRVVPADSVEGGVTVASGRIRLSNGHGSELLPLPLAATVQYYNGTAWVRSDTDTVTALIASDVALAFPAGTASKPNNLAACETAVSIAGISPAFEINLSAPGNGDDGWTNLMLNLGAAAVGNRCTAVGGAGAASTTANRPWLQFPAGTNPTARATFGVYKGNNEFIYLRENY